MKYMSNSNKFTFLGLEITKQNNKLHITQNTLIEKVLTKFGMGDCKEMAVPVTPKLNLFVEDNNNVNVPYKELIGIMHIMLGSRPLCTQ